jgi:hypothetical protein
VTPSEPLVLSARAVAAYGGDLLPEFLEEARPTSGPARDPFRGHGLRLADGGRTYNARSSASVSAKPRDELSSSCSRRCG